MRKHDTSVMSALQEVAGVTYDNAEYNRDIIDSYVLRKAREMGIRLPTGGEPDEYKYLGAHVETPTAGTSHNVIYIDVSSMYPHSILTLNASPETIVGTREDLEASSYTEDDCVWGYIDPRPVKHLAEDEHWQNFVDGTYKIVYDPEAPDTKWTCDSNPWESGPVGDGPDYTKLYFLSHETQKGFLTECVEELIALKNQYRGTSLYGSTKRVTNCFVEDTELLTPDGPVNVTDLEVGDTVWTVNTQTRSPQPTTVEETFQYPEYTDAVYHFQNEYVDLQVTPEHEMVYLDSDGNVQSKEAGKLVELLRARDVLLPAVDTHWNPGPARLSFDDVTRYDTCYGVYCVNVGGNNTVLAGRDGQFQPVKQSVYGVTGFATEQSSFRLFDWRLAEAITLCGRKMIQYSRDYVLAYLHDRGYEDAYAAIGDTDGVGISVPSAATRADAMEIVTEAVEALNGEGYDEFFQSEMGVDPEYHHGEIEIESYAAKVFVPSMNPPHGEIGRKKRYIEWLNLDEAEEGFEEVDEINYTGLEKVRSDVAPITKDAQEVFGEVLRLEDGPARGELFPKLREWHEQILAGEIELDRVCKRGGIGQPLSEYGTATRRASTFYRGCRYANQNISGVTIQEGDKPRLVYIEDVRGEYPSVYDSHTAEDGDPVDAVTVPDPAQLPEEFIVDWESHWKRALREPMKPLLETRFGEDAWSQCLHQHEQAGIADF